MANLASLARLTAPGMALLLVAGCATERKPPPRPVPTAAPRPVPPPAPVRAPADWRDAPATPGDWTYQSGPVTMARFGTMGTSPLLSLTCDRAGGAIVLNRAGAAAGSLPMTIVTTTLTRQFSAMPVAAAAPTLAVSFTPRDPMLDAMAFSRGRFAVEVSGLPTLYLPAWPEVGRVIEDCR